MENDAQYYWRRAVDERGAACRSLAADVRERHHDLALLYLKRLAGLGAPTPFNASELSAELHAFAKQRAAA